MILLGFTVRNHKSIRDETTLDLTHSSLRTLQPQDGNWEGVSYPVAGIFGGNASGKTALLEALIYAFTAISSSATLWQAEKLMPRAPFLLDGSAHNSSSAYELDFVHEGRRHLYGFEVDRDGIKREWLRDIPASRWRTLLDRDRDAGTLKFHQSLRAGIEVTRRELVLSRALLLPESALHPVAHDLSAHFDYMLVKEDHREAQLRHIANSLADGSIKFDDLESLLQIADIGIVKVKVEESKIPDNIRRILYQLEQEMRKEHEGTSTPDVQAHDEEPDELDEHTRTLMVRSLRFTHRGTTEECPPFSVKDESDGTVAWLAIAVPALEALRKGGLLVIDEIDSSLHPHLVDLLLSAFADPQINVRHAQLIFTSHESYVISPLSEVELAPEQIWFTDKSREGVTELFSLADFPKHPDANVARRYLTGRYGGVPRLLPSTLAALVSTETAGAEKR